MTSPTDPATKAARELLTELGYDFTEYYHHSAKIIAARRLQEYAEAAPFAGIPDATRKAVSLAITYALDHPSGVDLVRGDVRDALRAFDYRLDAARAHAEASRPQPDAGSVEVVRSAVARALPCRQQGTCAAYRLTPDFEDGCTCRNVARAAIAAMPPATLADVPAGERGAYYWNSLIAWRDELRRDFPIYERRLRSLREQSHPGVDDHLASMEVRRKMLKVVEDALALRRLGAARGGGVKCRAPTKIA